MREFMTSSLESLTAIARPTTALGFHQSPGPYPNWREKMTYVDDNRPDPEGWELAQEDYDCEQCGYPMGRNEDRVFWYNDTPFCSKRCAGDWQADHDAATAQHSGLCVDGFPLKSGSCF